MDGFLYFLIFGLVLLMVGGFLMARAGKGYWIAVGVIACIVGFFGLLTLLDYV